MLNLLRRARLAKQGNVDEPTEEGDFRLGLREGLPTCSAGYYGQRYCKYYRKGKQVWDGFNIFECIWFKDHECRR